jgi:hypothetical protein
VGDDLGVGLGGEFVAFLQQLAFQGNVVFDDAVVCDDNTIRAISMRVCILFVGRPCVAQRVWPRPKVPLTDL